MSLDVDKRNFTEKLFKKRDDLFRDVEYVDCSNKTPPISKLNSDKIYVLANYKHNTNTSHRDLKDKTLLLLPCLEPRPVIPLEQADQYLNFLSKYIQELKEKIDELKLPE